MALQTESEIKKKPFKRDLIEWAVILGIIATLYLTGWHTEIIGNLQRVLLWTGVMTPDTEMEANQVRDAQFDMPLLTLAGERTTLQQFKGETIFLNFWATWCPPCIAEMPNIQALYDEVQSDSIHFVMVSLDEDPQKATNFIERKGYTFPVYFLTGRKPGVYNSTVVPTTYIISPEGKIVSERRGMANYHTSAFKEFLLSL